MEGGVDGIEVVALGGGEGCDDNRGGWPIWDYCYGGQYLSEMEWRRNVDRKSSGCKMIRARCSYLT